MGPLVHLSSMLIKKLAIHPNCSPPAFLLIAMVRINMSALLLTESSRQLGSFSIGVRFRESRPCSAQSAILSLLLEIGFCLVLYGIEKKLKI